MITFVVILLAVGLVNLHEQILDAFDYPTTEAARAAWRAVSGTPPVEVELDADRPVLQLIVPFGDLLTLERVILDRDVRLDLSDAGHLALEMRLLDCEEPARVTLYFRSGAGWFAAGGILPPKQWVRLVFTKHQFRTEGTPAGWDRVDGVRLSVWRVKNENFRVQVRRLVAEWSDVALLIPRRIGTAEARAATQFAGSMAEILEHLGISFDRFDEDSIAEGALAKRKILIVPYHPALDQRTAAAIEEFMDQGGKLFAFYTLPASLRKRLGIRELRYWRPQEGGLAEVRFQSLGIAGLPPAMRQASWNINEPVADETARVLGFWFDRAGQPTGRVAGTLADGGVFFSHVLLPDDRENKADFVRAVVGYLHPPLWAVLARRAIQRAQLIGHCTSSEQLEDFLNSTEARYWPEYSESREILREAEALWERQQFPVVVEKAKTAREKLLLLYAKAMPSFERESRAFWNHSGTGAYPGDWERTARELAEAGFNMVLPNMLWGGLAHYPSELLPHSDVYRKWGDQIAQCLAACRRHGIEVHVWKVNWNLSTAPPEFVAQMRSEGRLQKSYLGEEHTWLCPSHPKNFALEKATMLEVVRNYDVDGIHFDYIRYPSEEFCYCEGCRQRFEQFINRFVSNWPAEARTGNLREAYLEFRVAQINRLVEEVAREARQLKPNIKISAAVFGGYPECRRSVGQDWVQWVKAGHLDFVCPMNYTQDDTTFERLVSNQLRLVEGKVPVYPGIGAWRLSPDRVIGQVFLARSLGASGFTVFDLSEEAARSLLPIVRLGVGAKEAIPPHRGNE